MIFQLCFPEKIIFDTMKKNWREKIKPVIDYLKRLVIGAMFGWCLGDAILLCRGDMRPLTRKGIELECITQTKRYYIDSIGAAEQKTTFLGFRFTLLR